MIKILYVTSQNNGSKYHRLELPLSYLNKEEFEVVRMSFVQITEEMLKDIDILYYHYDLSIGIVDSKLKMINNYAQIALWQNKHKFKIVVDMDDSWKVAPNHKNAKLIQAITPFIKDGLILSDLVTCTTDILASDILEFNKNVKVIKNRLPYGDDQFALTNFENTGKIRIGVIGSHSHYSDWISIKNDINRIINDPEILSKCELYVCGYDQSNKESKDLWDAVAALFKNKAKIVGTRDVYHYMESYNNLDVVLAPLCNNFQNKAKSELKILEAACKNAIVIGSNLYRDKSSFEGLMFFDDEMSYYNRIKQFCKMDTNDFYKMKLEMASKVRENHLFKPVIEEREYILKTLCNEL
jgi:hypothetical protein